MSIAALVTIGALASLASAQAPTPLICDKKQLPDGWAPGLTVPLQQVTQGPANAPYVCSGNIQVIDGCSFMVKNFTFSSSIPAAQWYAGVVGKDASGAIVSNPNGVHFANPIIGVSQAMDSVTYTLVTDAGASYSWFSVNELRAFSLNTNVLVCVAEMPYQNPKNTVTNGTPAKTTGAPAAGGAATTSASVGATTSKSGAENVVAAFTSIFGAAAAAIAYFL
ncbi:hypothetical protein HK101_000650 [Irineochytrium annulatum]|nr:hypothetical protein HK101_000650 [Irineochytrium annulatum]